MKRFLSIFLCAILLIGVLSPIVIANFTISSTNAYEPNPEKILDTKYGYVLNDKRINKVVLYGTFTKDSPYAEKIRIEIKNNANKTILTISPKTDYGYNPTIILANFDKGNLKQIFLGMSSGGSGGFGYYYIYSVENNEIKTLFDYEEWDINYTAKYIDNYKVVVTNTTTNEQYLIDISLRDKAYLNQIYNENAKLLKPRDADVSLLNTAFPYYNATQSKYQLEVMQRITGLYNADSLGYMLNYCDLKNNEFIPYFTMLGVL